MFNCHSNETRAPIANPRNSAQLAGTLYHSPGYIRVRAVVWECGEGETDRQTDTQMVVTNIQFATATPHAKCDYCKDLYRSTILNSGARQNTNGDLYRQLISEEDVSHSSLKYVGQARL